MSLSTPTNVKVRLENHNAKTPFTEDRRFGPVPESSTSCQDTGDVNAMHQKDGANGDTTHKVLNEQVTASSSYSSSTSSSSSSSSASSPSMVAPSTPVIRPAPSEEQLAGLRGKISMTAASETAFPSSSSGVPQKRPSIKWDIPGYQNHVPAGNRKFGTKGLKITTTTTTKRSPPDKQQPVTTQESTSNEKESISNDNEEEPGETLTSVNIGSLPTDKLIKMLTTLLDKIVHSNDRLDDKNLQVESPASVPNPSATSSPTPVAETASGITNVRTPDREEFTNDPNSTDDPLYTETVNSVLSFKGKHVPQIGIEQYFQRIQKYCPTTNDIYISLLIYFDRISKKCNHIFQNHDARVQRQRKLQTRTQQPAVTGSSGTSMRINSPSSLIENESEIEEESINSRDGQERSRHIFVMDSYNIHRLIIAGVTVGTKFLSDFFYSNSRYARVGGISLKEMNHLELQFLILCDFELLISVEEMERYANLLHRFWANDKYINDSDQ